MNYDFSNIKVNLVGDYMLDHYIMGTSTRISPEAPVPVVKPIKEYFTAGGAGNVALNLKTLGANVNCFGFVGNDMYGENLINLLTNQGISCKGIEKINNHQTTVKQRIYSNGIQISRLDREELYNKWIPNFDINNKDSLLVISDYNKGIFSNISIKNNECFTIIDPKNENFSLYKNAMIITPNIYELQKATKCDIDDLKSIEKACTKLIMENNFKYILLKRGSEGMIIYGNKNYSFKIKGHNVESPDVTGAGDTVIAALSLAYRSSGCIETAAEFANKAAALAVSKPGTSTISIDEINN
jgi:rfaE bifunctional protein kinase chain/domain